MLKLKQKSIFNERRAKLSKPEFEGQEKNGRDAEHITAIQKKQEIEILVSMTNVDLLGIEDYYSQLSKQCQK